jgi:hypothetical protein
MATKFVNGKQCVRRESVLGHVEELQFWTGTPNYTAQVIRLIDQCVDTGETVKEAFTWRYTNRRLDKWIYGKPAKTVDEARAAYWTFINA